MKRLLITAVMVSAAMLTSSAQMFIGGSLGVGFTSAKEKAGSTTTDYPSVFSFEIAPKAGYYLNDKMAVGLELGLLRATANDRAETETKNFVTQFGISAFGRYHLVEVDKFALILEASLGFQTAKAKSKTGSNSFELPSTNGVGLFVLPVLSYSLSDRLSLEASCDFLSFGFARASIKTEGAGDIPDSKYIQNYFGLGVSPSDIATTIGTIGEELGEEYAVYETLFSTPFSVGLVWKF